MIGKLLLNFMNLVVLLKLSGIRKTTVCPTKKLIHKINEKLFLLRELPKDKKYNFAKGIEQ